MSKIYLILACLLTTGCSTLPRLGYEARTAGNSSQSTVLYLKNTTIYATDKQPGIKIDQRGATVDYNSTGGGLKGAKADVGVLP